MAAAARVMTQFRHKIFGCVAAPKALQRRCKGVDCEHQKRRSWGVQVVEFTNYFAIFGCNGIVKSPRLETSRCARLDEREPINPAAAVCRHGHCYVVGAGRRADADSAAQACGCRDANSAKETRGCQGTGAIPAAEAGNQFHTCAGEGGSEPKAIGRHASAKAPAGCGQFRAEAKLR